MDGFECGGSTRGSSSQGTVQFHYDSADDVVFDATQYAFFGDGPVEEVELGGLVDKEEEAEEEDIRAAEFEDFEFDQEEVDLLLSCLDLNELGTTESEKCGEGSEPTQSGVISGRESRESSFAVERTHDADYLTWYDQNVCRGIGAVPKGRRWSSHSNSPSDGLGESKSLCTTSSYSDPQPQLLPHFSSEPIAVLESSHSPFPPPDGRSLQEPLNHHPTLFLGRGEPISFPSYSSFSGPLASFPNGSHFGGNLSQLSPCQRVNQTNLYHGDRSNPVNMLQPPLSYQNGFAPPQLMTHQQVQKSRLQHPVLPPYANIRGMSQQGYGQQLSASPPTRRFEAVHGIPDIRDQGPESVNRSRPFLRSQQSFDMYGQSGGPRFGSKYMTAEEIENVLRMQLMATHGNEPYVDDYYHQACLAKRSVGAQLEHHFCPSELGDLCPCNHPGGEQHSFLQVEGLGRVALSSIRRPRPLIEVDAPNSSGSGRGEWKVCEKLLEEEPLIAARVTIEDCMRLLLVVDDVDRLLQFNRLPDVGIVLKQRRLAELRKLASLLQLVDPLRNDGKAAEGVPMDDLMFMRIVSLPKGRKLVSRFLGVLFPGDELLGILCMTIFRHLRFLFGVLPPDPASAETTINLAETVSSCVRSMDLVTLSWCLACVVSSSEQPPLRPVGSPAGDGASKILIAVLDRATELLRDPHAVSSSGIQNWPFWQASFDEFFGLVVKYCVSRYDLIVQPLPRQMFACHVTVQSDLAKDMKMEMPVEVLRASLPH